MESIKIEHIFETDIGEDEVYRRVKENWEGAFHHKNGEIGYTVYVTNPLTDAPTQYSPSHHYGQDVDQATSAMELTIKFNGRGDGEMVAHLKVDDRITKRQIANAEHAMEQFHSDIPWSRWMKKVSCGIKSSVIKEERDVESLLFDSNLYGIVHGEASPSIYKYEDTDGVLLNVSSNGWVTRSDVTLPQLFAQIHDSMKI